MNMQFIKYTVICIGIIIGILTSSFLLIQELSTVPITYASGVDLSGNFSDKNATIQNITGNDSIYSNFFSGSNKQIELKKQAEPINVPVITQPETVKIPVKKNEIHRATTGTKCPAKKDRPSISSRNNKNHMDEDCCSDYDEWPKPGCAYTAEDFEIMLPGPTKGHVKHR